MGRRTWARLAAAVAIGGLLLGGTTPVATAAVRFPDQTGATAPSAAQKYYWKWSDGSQKTARVFREKTYKTQAKLPHLVVTAVPAKPAKEVLLQFKQKGKWILENKVTTNDKGVANIELNPFCSNDTWCDGTWSYRLKIGSQYQNLKIGFSEK